mmetsp:Transcript_96634/g.277504  ORF Transcript_96634/g.277504 Transcript_96634/m.277504 type:complete len:287 (-) Transcript_96634:679-1539(-)
MLHRVQDLGILGVPAGTDVRVDLAGIRRIRLVGDEERQGAEPLEATLRQPLVPAVAVLLHVLCIEVHEDQAFVHLHHAILQTGLDADLLLHREDKGRLLLQRNVIRGEVVEFHEGLEQRSHNRAAACKTNLARNVRVIPRREVLAGQGDAAGGAELLEPLASGHQQAGASIVAFPPADEVQVCEAAEGGWVVERMRQKPQLFAFPKLHGRPEVPHRHSDGLAVEAVARVAHQPHTSIRLRPNMPDGPAPRLAELPAEASIQLLVLLQTRRGSDQEEGPWHPHAPKR